jgi:methionine synthase II (cobalamin-independent)
MNLNEQILRIKGLINELAPHSAGVQELITQVKNMPELLKHIHFKSIIDLEEYIEDANYEDFIELRNEINNFIQRRKKYFKSEMDEFERASQDLSRDEGIKVSVNQLLDAFEKAKEVKTAYDNMLSAAKKANVFIDADCMLEYNMEICYT